MIKEAIKRLSYVLFPKRCELCGEVISIDECKCNECRTLEKIKGELCLVCGCEKEHCSCAKNEKKPEYEQIVSPYYYEKSIIQAIHRFKLYGYKELASAMSAEIADTVSDRYCEKIFDYVAFIPMTEKKLRKRGYNQAMLLAQGVAEIINAPFADLLVKTIDTPSQRESTAKQRKLNLYGVYDLKQDIDLNGMTVLLIDDVKTTGSTLNECAVILKSGGATVYCATLAVTRKKK